MRVAGASLTLLLAGAACAAAVMEDFGGVVAFGLLALVTGLWLLERPGRAGFPIAALAFATLPGAAGMQMTELAGSITPFSVSLYYADLSDVTLPLASAGEFDPRRPPRRVVIVRPADLIVRSVVCSLDGVRAHVQPDMPLLIRADRDAPWRTVGWVLDIARSAGLAEVRVAASKYVRRRHTDEEADLLGGELHPGEWPTVELVVPLAAAERSGPTLRIAPAGPAARIRSRDGEDVARVPTRALYELARRDEAGLEFERRSTTDLLVLSQWFRESPPGRIEPDDAVPFKFVVAVWNELAKAGRPFPPFVTPDPPDEEMRSATAVPYPAYD